MPLIIYCRPCDEPAQTLIWDLEDAGIEHEVVDIDEERPLMEAAKKAAGWPEKGQAGWKPHGFPIVDMYGNLEEQPSFAEIQKASKAPGALARPALKAKAAANGAAAAWKGSAGMKKEAVEKVKKVFSDCDADGSGSLGFAEVKGLLKKLNPRFTDAQLQRIFDEADTSENGLLDIGEFCDYIFLGKKGAFDKWKKDILDAHNLVRKQHGACALKWSDECYQLAKKQANACRAANRMFHGNTETAKGDCHGQNIIDWGRDRYGRLLIAPAKKSVAAWYGEILNPGYDFDNVEKMVNREWWDNHLIGHFTQTIWKATSYVGMARSDDGRYCVANYWPPGNSVCVSAFEREIGKPEGLAAENIAWFRTHPELR
eukprot:TRINITY_DN80559_c0_g1_i1.p1 TRINITY_DN80559_c0_g1~~TRINITY_DN80559_c0_g1_i1.p1  ORF type:complete len:371 (+),score=63.01 TRINITY_DN80559_c0_g1_i1:65-1177(+)